MKRFANTHKINVLAWDVQLGANLFGYGDSKAAGQGEGMHVAVL